MLLARRRIDPTVFAAASAAFPLYIPIPVVLAGMFGLSGIYVALSRVRRLVEHLCSPYGLIVLYCLWSLVLIGARGQLEAGNRQLGFMVLLLGLTFIAPGLCLVRRPLRTFILGARVGVYAAFVLALVMSISFGDALERWNGGGNAAIVALLILLGAITATIRLNNPPKCLPNGLQHIALASFPIFLTETRAVLIVVPILFLAEFFFWSLRWRPRIRNRSYAAVLLAAGLMLLAPPVQNMIAGRFVTVYEHYVAGKSDDGMESGDIRLTMWKAAAQVIREHPLSGVGIMDMFPHMKVAAGPNAEMIAGFKHVHNFVLQELLANGVVGLVLLGSIVAAFLLTVLRRAPEESMRRAAIYFFCSVGIFGMLHDPLYHELCMSTIMLFVGAYMAQFRRWKTLTPAATRQI
ncbi:O-antigen ligase family protein [Rhizobium sp. SAFR-030]|uniref:O-antigen ligase family protein n=1 Tax=Rhizobium sp. SAFR-030 TaxID=3387277 RepID=UPI003F7DFC40